MQIQRNLQLRIEEQGKYLQMMFEKQCKSTSIDNNPLKELKDVRNSPAKDSSTAEAEKEDQEGEPPRERQSTVEAEGSPPTKRAKVDEQIPSSSIPSS